MTPLESGLMFAVGVLLIVLTRVHHNYDRVRAENQDLRDALWRAQDREERTGRRA